MLAGLGGLAVPALIGRIPPDVPDAEPDESSERGSEVDGTVDATPDAAPPELPEPYADIARLPGLGWKSAVAAALAGAVVGLAVGWTWALVLWVPLVPVVGRPGRGRLADPSPAHRRDPPDVRRAGRAGARRLGRDRRHRRGHPGRAGVARGRRALRPALADLPARLGFGDVRLAGVLGIALGWVGWGALIVGVYAGFLLGGILGGLLSVLRIVERKGFPFGPFMLLGALVALLWGEPLWSSLVSG